jgi:hypothetical protein
VGNQLALDRLLGDKANRPPRPSLGRFPADHRHDALFLGVVEQRLRSRPLLVIQGAVETTIFVTVSDLANGLRGKWQRPRNSGRGDSLGELPRSQCPQNDADLLNAAAE